MGGKGPERVRFGVFELDLRAGELRRNGVRVRVPYQSIQVLAMLLEDPGEVVTREELQRKLWPNGTIVEFEHGINAAIKRLRQALEDSADSPRYIETLPRHGYRFIFPIERSGDAQAAPTVQLPGDGEPAGNHSERYRLLEKLGSGGMGVVYRAEDNRLKRIVAVKVISEHLSDDPQMRERFEREARAVARLNHPNICAVYDLVRQDAADLLVMECLAGETLSSRLEKGPLPFDQVLQYAIQIAAALDLAHRQGIIHRDLKPGNLMLTKSGVKLLDFGLAKFGAKAAEGMTADAAPLTARGTILGTLPYMAPEQVEGKEADARSDIFALGAIIYEMATGQRAFDGKTQASLISAILTSEPPPISSSEQGAPGALNMFVRTCLEKDPDARWQSAHDALIQLKWIYGIHGDLPGNPPPRRSLSKIAAWTFAGLAFLGALGVAGYYLVEPKREGRPLRFQIPPPPHARFAWEDYGPSAVVSPDGRQMACIVVDDARQMLWLRHFDAIEMRRLPNTENARLPFWSPDARFIAFFSGGRLKTINLSDGTVRDLCRASLGYGGTWSRNGTIVFAPGYRQPLQSIPAAGGEPVSAINLDTQAGETAQLAPSFLPDGRHVLYWSWRKGSQFTCLASIDSKQTNTLNPDAGQAIYAGSGLLLVVQENSLLARPFDPGKLRFVGEPRRIMEHSGNFSVSENGVLVYLSDESSAPVLPGASTTVQLTWYGRDGSHALPVGEPLEYGGFALSPDGQFLAVERGGPPPNIWILDLTKSIMSRFTQGNDGQPVWSPDGRELVFTSRANGQYRISRKVIATGEEELLLASAEESWVKSWSRDGAYLIYLCGDGICRLPLHGERTPEVLMKFDFDVDEPKLSPDGRWLAYNSTESGRWEVYVAELPMMRNKRQVSTNGGAQPQWRNDGKELFYLAMDGKLMAAETVPGPSLRVGAPHPLFQTHLRTSGFNDQYFATRDGQRFLVAEPANPAIDTITVVVNWAAGLK